MSCGEVEGEWGGTRWGVSCHTSLDSCWCGGRGTWQRRGHWDPFLEFLPIYHTFFSWGWTKLGRWGTFSKSSHFSPLHSIYKTKMSDSSKSKKCLGNGLSTSFHKEQKETGIVNFLTTASQVAEIKPSQCYCFSSVDPAENGEKRKVLSSSPQDERPQQSLKRVRSNLQSVVIVYGAEKSIARPA